MSETGRLLIQVVPQLMPGRCGVSDQAVLLAKGLKDAFGIESAFVVLNSAESSGLPYSEVHCAPSLLLEVCLKLTGGQLGAILVHLSGYGYSADGAPTLLAESLEKVKVSGYFHIAVYVHETFATGPPWKSAYWHSRRQQIAVRRIVAQCGLIVTNIERHAEWLEKESRGMGGTPIERMPVSSNAGESGALVPFAQRNAAMVVFGLGRKTAYQKLAAAGNLLGNLDILEILDVGPECEHPSEVNGVRVRRVGLLPAEELPDVISQARFGFVAHPSFFLGKSSVFAAYCAHGTIPVLTGPFPESADGLREGVHVVTPRTVEAVRRSGWEACSRAAWSWYNGHRVSAHVELYAKWLGGRR